MTPAERFALETFPDGAVLLDLASGLLYQLNLAAAFAWRERLAGVDGDNLVRAFASRFGIDETRAWADVQRALDLPVEGLSEPADAQFWYEPVPAGYRWSFRGTPVMEIAADGQRLRALEGLAPADVFTCLAAIAPKLVALAGATVLHASAVLRPGGSVMAFLGESGAGKTTTAHAFAKHGWPLISEDKLILHARDGRIVAEVEGEKKLAARMRALRLQIESTRSTDWLPLGLGADLAANGTAIAGPIILLDSTRRSGHEIALNPVAEAPAAAAIFRTSFYGSASSEAWRRHLQTAAALARAAQTFTATMPAGIEPLEAAARAYTESTQS